MTKRDADRRREFQMIGKMDDALGAPGVPLHA
jgi:hypothetical protein